VGTECCGEQPKLKEEVAAVEGQPYATTRNAVLKSRRLLILLVDHGEKVADAAPSGEWVVVELPSAGIVA
jgi:hypothetical protein